MYFYLKEPSWQIKPNSMQLNVAIYKRMKHFVSLIRYSEKLELNVIAIFILRAEIVGSFAEDSPVSAHAIKWA